jgi:hypothetical protein
MKYSKSLLLQMQVVRFERGRWPQHNHDIGWCFAGLLVVVLVAQYWKSCVHVLCLELAAVTICGEKALGQIVNFQQQWSVEGAIAHGVSRTE